jgi:hypothetical protein
VNREAANPAAQTQQPRIFRPRPGGNRQYFYINLAIDHDPAIQRYFETIKSRRRNRGYLSPMTVNLTHYAVRSFLGYIGITVTDHAIRDLIEDRRLNPGNTSIDDSLLSFSNLNPILSHRDRAIAIKGIFHRNGVLLYPSIDNHCGKRTPKISDGILKEIFEAQDFEKQTMMEMQAYAGERIRCLAKGVKLSQIRRHDDKYSVIEVEYWQTKARLPHICIIPNRVADAIKDIATRTGRKSPFPNYESLWRQITRYAYEKYGVRLTSHYLRKRFHSIAQKTAMPVNHWDYLMGDSMKEGHEAGVYTLDDDTEIIQEYDRFLAPRLSLSDPQDDFLLSPLAKEDMTSLARTIETLSQHISKLLQENSDLRKQLTALARMP